MIPQEPLTNRVLTESPARDQEAVLAVSQPIVLRAGQTFAAAGEPVQAVFFPVSGVVTYVREMTTGHEVSVAAVGREGMVAATAVALTHHPYRIAALLDARGHQVRIDSLRRAFNEREGFRTAVAADLARQWTEVTSLVACGRVHSHRQRVARWLLMTMDKSRESSLVLRHDDLARLVGSTRHAVTHVLNALEREGAIAHTRGRIEVVDRALLVREACECHRHSVEVADPLEIR